MGVAVDSSGKLYVANQGGDSVSVFDTEHGNAVLPAITGNGLCLPAGVAIDSIRGKLYVANECDNSVTSPPSVRVFDTAHGNAALPPIRGGGLNESYGVAVDASGKLYVSGVDNVSVFDTAHGNAPTATISTEEADYYHGVAVH